MVADEEVWFGFTGWIDLTPPSKVSKVFKTGRLSLDLGPREVELVFVQRVSVKIACFMGWSVIHNVDTRAREQVRCLRWSVSPVGVCRCGRVQ